MSQQRSAGPCDHCGKVVSLLSNGVVRCHGPIRQRCPGSNKPPNGTSSGNEVPSVKLQETIQLSEEPTSLEYAEAVRRARSKTLNFVPKGSRPHFATALEKAERATLRNPSSSEAWLRLSCIASICLKAPARAGRERKRCSLATHVNRQIDTFLSTEPLQAPPPRSSVREQKPTSDEEQEKHVARRVCAKLDEGDITGAVRLASSNNTLIRPTQASCDSLRDKHPPRPSDRQAFPTSDVPPLVTTQKLVMDCVQSFPAGAAAGPSGFRPQHLQDAMSRSAGEAGQRLLATQAEFTDFLLSGQVPSWVRPVLAGANLISLRKPSGGIRPIAVGETFRRLAGKCIVRVHSDRAARFLAPISVGVGVVGAAEAAVHGVRDFCDTASSGDVLVKVDFENAFNSLRRDMVAKAIADFAPDVLPFYTTCYESTSLLFYGSNFFIESAEGLQQGDPIASLACTLTLHPLLVNLSSALRVGYQDDITLCGPAEDVATDLIMLRESAAGLGLSFNEAKCEVAALHGNDHVAVLDPIVSVCPTIRIVSSSDLTLLGAPVGSDAAPTVLNEKLQALKRLCMRLNLILPHQAFFLLKNAFALPRLMYFLRSGSCFLHESALLDYDNVIKLAFQRLANIQLSASMWTQVTLTTKMGGFGLVSAADLAPSAFLASRALVCELETKIRGCSLQADLHNAALAAWRRQAPSGQQVDDTKRQKSWFQPVLDARQAALLEQHNDAANIARIHGVACPGAGAWLNALPSTTLGLLMSAEEFRIATALRLGAPVSSTHACVRGTVADELGLHALVCPRLQSRHARHADCNAVIRRAFQAAHIPTTLEPTGLLRSDGRRPDGAILVPWESGKSLAWDFTCVHRLALSYALPASVPGSNVASDAERRKLLKYCDLPSNVFLQPVAVETLGGFGETTTDFLRHLGSRISENTNDTRETAFLQQRLAVAVQRGNAACVRESLELF